MPCVCSFAGSMKRRLYDTAPHAAKARCALAHQSTVVPSQHSSLPESSGPALAMTCSRQRTAVSAVNSILAGTAPRAA